ncbi:MAG TPA: inositol monophosphatase family protein, partial [Deinococcales bacterium]|nr:inositol monophosphatase family protein [Deinococcales bacterium]
MGSSVLTETLRRVTPAVIAAGRYARAEAAALIWEDASLDVRSKADPTDFVTRVDEELERRLVTFLQEEFPGSGILAEEGSEHRLGADDVWVLDPLDGTRNFIRQHPGYCVSLALVREGRPVVGLIYDITADALYTAVRGGGAYCNGRPL